MSIFTFGNYANGECTAIADSAISIASTQTNKVRLRGLEEKMSDD